MLIVLTNTVHNRPRVNNKKHQIFGSKQPVIFLMNNEDANKDIYSPEDRGVWDTMCMVVVIIGERGRGKGDGWRFNMQAIYTQLAMVFHGKTALGN